MPESGADVVFELVVQPAVQAKQPSTTAIARISRRMRGRWPPGGNSLVMDLLFLGDATEKPREAEGRGTGLGPPDINPLRIGAIVSIRSSVHLSRTPPLLF
jgi:hypothetical protein